MGLKVDRYIELNPNACDEGMEYLKTLNPQSDIEVEFLKELDKKHSYVTKFARYALLSNFKELSESFIIKLFRRLTTSDENGKHDVYLMKILNTYKSIMTEREVYIFSSYLSKRLPKFKG